MPPGRLLVTGGAGLLGRHVVPRARRAGWDVAAPSSVEMDVRDRSIVDRFVGAFEPDAVVHLAYRRDDGEVIVDGSAHIARSAAAHGARLVHLSTDVVFAGRAEPYTELDTPDPVHDYGRWKVEAERRVADIDPGAVIVRTSLMYATDGSPACQADVVAALDGRSDVRFFVDEVRCFTLVDDVAAAAVGLAGDPSVTGPLHVVAPEPIDRAGFARHVARWLGRDPAGVPVGTIAESGLERPAVVVLDTARATSLGITCRTLEAGLPVLRQR